METDNISIERGMTSNVLFSILASSLFCLQIHKQLLKNMLNDFICFLSHECYLSPLSHFWMERLVQSFWACLCPVVEYIASGCWESQVPSKRLCKKLLPWMRAFHKYDREQDFISINLDLSSSYVILLDTCFLKFISNSFCCEYLCKAVTSVLGLFIYCL